MIYAYGQLWDYKPAPVPPFHVEAVRVFGTVPFAGFFFTGYGRCGGEFFSRLSCVTPVSYRVCVSLVIHEYQLQKKEIKKGRAAGERVQSFAEGQDRGERENNLSEAFPPMPSGLFLCLPCFLPFEQAGFRVFKIVGQPFMPLLV